MADRYAGFAEFVDTRGRALMRTASLLTRDVGHAEDALQEALTKAALRWPSINRVGNPEPYVRQVLYTVVMSQNPEGGHLAWHGGAFTAVTSEGSTTYPPGPPVLVTAGSSTEGPLYVNAPRSWMPGDKSPSLTAYAFREGTADVAGGAYALTTLPPGATTVSFASELVG